MTIKKTMEYYLNLFGYNSKKLTISVTDRCNMECKICNIWKGYRKDSKKKLKEFTLSDYEKFFKEENAWNFISFTGGEPFLRTDLDKIVLNSIENCKRLHTISITTNGYLTGRIENAVKKILSTGIIALFINISLDGKQQAHDVLRGKKDSFNNAMKTFDSLKKIKDKRLLVHFEYTLSRYNQKEFCNDIRSLGLSENEFILNFAQRSEFYRNTMIKCEPDDGLLKKQIRLFLSKYRITNFFELGQWLFLNYKLYDIRIPCVAGKNSWYIDSRGSIFRCILKKDRDYAKFEKNGNNPTCFCYTPCESYFSLLLSKYSVAKVFPYFLYKRIFGSSKIRFLKPGK